MHEGRTPHRQDPHRHTKAWALRNVPAWASARFRFLATMMIKSGVKDGRGRGSPRRVKRAWAAKRRRKVHRGKNWYAKSTRESREQTCVRETAGVRSHVVSAHGLDRENRMGGGRSKGLRGMRGVGVGAWDAAGVNVKGGRWRCVFEWEAQDGAARCRGMRELSNAVVAEQGHRLSKGISHALKPVPKTMWERRNWSSRSQSPSDDRYGSCGDTSKKRGCKCEKRLNARGLRDTGEALRPVSSSAIAVATTIQLINTVHSNW